MKKYLTLLVLIIFLAQCSTVPITGRKRLNLVGDKRILPTSFAQYNQFLKENQLSNDQVMTYKLRKIGKNISKSVDQFMRANGMTKEADSYQWEFNLVEDNTVNAWCLPGGKIVFYTGILPYCANDDGIAAVMGHEIAHAFAKHGNERMTQAKAQMFGGIIVALGTNHKDRKTRDIWNLAYGLSTTVGILAYSRAHETEADKLGLVFMLMAGYDGEEAAEVWVRMSQNTSSNGLPNFLRTHPSNENRIKRLRAYLPEAKKLADQYQTASQ